MIDVETYAAAKAYTDAHGGSSGTTNYNSLDNKPQINGVELSGNSTASELGLVASVEGKGLSTNDYTNEDKAIVGGVTSALSGKVDKVEGKGLSTNDYTDEDKAIVDGVTDALAEKADTADVPAIVGNNLAKGIFGNETVLSTDNVPFISKIMGTGKYQRKKFVGCSFVWNQLVENGDFASDTGWTATNGTLSIANNVATITATSNGAVQFYRAINQKTTGHVVLVSFDCECSQNISLSVNWGDILKTVSISPTKQRITFVATVGSGNNYFNFYATNMTANETVKYSNVILTDLTQLFGSTAIADYIYNLEQTTAGAGVAKLKEMGFFTEDYYAYDAGSVQSVDIKEYSVLGDSTNLFGGKAMIKNSLLVHGANVVIDETADTIDFRADTSSGSKIMSFDKWVKPNTQYTFMLTFAKTFGTSASNMNVVYTDGTTTTVPAIPSSEFVANKPATVTFTTAENKTISHIRCLYSSGGTKLYADESGVFASGTTEFEPYHFSTYPLTPTELRGVPKIDANNNIYADGDEYSSDGEVTRKYGIVDLGTLDWTLLSSGRHSATVSGAKPVGNTQVANAITTKYTVTSSTSVGDYDMSFSLGLNNQPSIVINDSALNGSTVEDFKAAMSGQYLVYEKATPTTETLTPFDYPQSVGSIEEIVDYKVEQEDRDVAIPTGHVTEYMGKGGEFTLPTLPETPSVLAYDGHNFFWKPETT